MNTVRSFLANETGLATISTTQADGRVLSSVANCGVVQHPVSGEECVALVSRGNAARLGHVRRGSEMTIAVRRGWSWIAVTGSADLIGPEDPSASVDGEAQRLLLREIYQAAGGQHDDYAEYDRAMIEDGRTAIFVKPERIVGVQPS